MKNKKSILIVISNFGDEQIEYLKKVIDNFNGFKKYKTEIIIHSNIKLEKYGISEKVKIFESTNPFSLIDIPFKFKITNKWSKNFYSFHFIPITCRQTIYEMKNDYDYFIFTENDHLWEEFHVDNHIMYEEILPNDKISGLIQFETDGDQYYYPGYHKKFEWDFDSIEVYANKVFAHFTNVHQGSFLISKSQLSRICDKYDFTNYFFKKTIYSTKCMVNTDIYENEIYKKLICISDFKSNLIHHLPNLYIKGEKGRKKLRSDSERMEKSIEKILALSRK